MEKVLEYVADIDLPEGYADQLTDEMMEHITNELGEDYSIDDVRLYMYRMRVTVYVTLKERR